MKYLKEIKRLIDNIEITDSYGNIKTYETGINEIVERLQRSKKQKNKVFLCGNGGSMAISQHMTADFFKNGGIITQSLYNPATLTCIANDLEYEYVFCKQLELLFGKNDILIAISSSGESKNICRAIQVVRLLGGRIITLTGFKQENQIRRQGDINIYVPAEHYGMVESIHNMVLQQIVDMIVERDGIAMAL